MLERLLQKLKTGAPRLDAEAEQRLAAAVLLVEMARADHDSHESERSALRAGLVREFGVAEATVDALLQRAAKRAQESVSLYDFVKTLNETMSVEKKRELLALLWKVAYADGRIDAHEEHLLRRLADMLYLSHADFIAGKLANTN